MSNPITRPLTFESVQTLVSRDASFDADMRRVEKLDFSMLRMKLVSEHGWTAEVCDEVEDLYRKFLVLNLRYPDVKLCPNGSMDMFWHAHILDTRKYADDCESLFGGLLHHYPYFGLRGPDDRSDLERAFAGTIDLFIRHFGIDPTAGDSQARSCRPQKCP